MGSGECQPEDGGFGTQCVPFPTAGIRGWFGVYISLTPVL